MKILFIKASNCRDVRLQKYIRVLSCSHNRELHFLGWSRFEEEESFRENIKNCIYLLDTRTKNKLKLLFYLFVWEIKLLFFLLMNYRNYDLIYCADLEAVFPLWITQKICKKKINYLYDIYDEFALRYNFLKVFNVFFSYIEKKVRVGALLLIHVDKMRCSALDNNCQVVIIENAPLDFYRKKENMLSVSRKICYRQPLFVISGYLSQRRGLSSILCFIKDNPDYRFFVAGRFTSLKSRDEFLNLANVTIKSFMPQSQLFYEISHANGIFSLYDPSIEINMKAASNKLYDAMMLGIPVITNKEIEASTFVRDNCLGISVPYVYEKKIWDQEFKRILKPDDFSLIRKNARNLFEKKFNIEKKILEVFDSCEQLLTPPKK